MTVNDTVVKSVKDYPSLYLAKTFEESKFLVLHYYFCVLGNGIEWAKNNDIHYGYLTSPQYKRVNDEWELIPDKPYGESRETINPRFFQEEVYFYAERDDSFDFIAIPKTKSSGKEKTLYFHSELDKLNPDEYHLYGDRISDLPPDKLKPYVLEKIKLNTIDRDPYPYFDKQYSPFWEIAPELIQKDWREAGIEHLKHWVKYFNDPERIKSYNYYPKPDELKKYVLGYKSKKYKELSEEDWIKQVNVDYNANSFTGDNWEEFAMERWNDTLTEAKEYLKDTIERLSL